MRTNLADKIWQKTEFDLQIGELLTKAKAACDAGREPDAAIAPTIRKLEIRSKALALEIGEMMIAKPHKVQLAMGKAYDAALVAAYVAYAKDPNQKTYDKILDKLLRIVKAAQQ
jgi:hypothetical protein